LHQPDRSDDAALTRDDFELETFGTQFVYRIAVTIALAPLLVVAAGWSYHRSLGRRRIDRLASLQAAAFVSARREISSWASILQSGPWPAVRSSHGAHDRARGRPCVGWPL